MILDMDDGHNGRSESALDDATMDTERDEDSGRGDEDKDVAATTSGDGAASAAAVVNLCLSRPPLSQHTALGGATTASGSTHPTTSPLREASCGIVAGSSSCSTQLQGSSSSSSLPRLEQLARLNNKTIICDMEDPKPGPSNSAADFDLEVINKFQIF